VGVVFLQWCCLVVWPGRNSLPEGTELNILISEKGAGLAGIVFCWVVV
jgi:hypothetical protein